MRWVVKETCQIVTNENAAFLKRRLRTQKMLERYHLDRQKGLYDVAIVGHTHQSGEFGNWYFNSGSWTGKSNNFLNIRPDSTVNVYNWTQNGQIINHNVIAG